MGYPKNPVSIDVKRLPDSWPETIKLIPCDHGHNYECRNVTRRQGNVTKLPWSHMGNNPNITTAQLTMIPGCAETTAENHIAYLRNNSYIEGTGSRKAGWRKVKNSEDEEQ